MPTGPKRKPFDGPSRPPRGRPFGGPGREGDRGGPGPRGAGGGGRGGFGPGRPSGPGSGFGPRGPRTGARPGAGFGPREQEPAPFPKIEPEPSSGREEFLSKGIRVVYEDADVIVVDKPAGIVTADPAQAAGAPTEMRPSAKPGQTVFGLVKKHVRDGGKPVTPKRMSRAEREREGAGPGPGRVWVIHRLDKDASGLIVFAKSERAFLMLKEALKNREIRRVYTAVAEGTLGRPGEMGTRRSIIAEDRGPSSAAARSGKDREGGAPAVTHYRVLAVSPAQGGRTLLEAKLDTGRKNQIRIHMQELGHPLVGDFRFGAKTDAIKRLALHATELGFFHPGAGRHMLWRSTPPEGFFKAVGVDEKLTPVMPGTESIGGGEGSSEPAPAAETSWDGVAGWYDQLLDEQKNDHYEKVILPGTAGLLSVTPGLRVLDVACGQGIVSRFLAERGASVVGVDASPKLIEAAKKRSPEITFDVFDARKVGEIEAEAFDAAVCVMAMSNIEPLVPMLEGVAKKLKPGGMFVGVITHPAFRAPGQSDWGWDAPKGRQYRRVEAYLSPFERSIAMHPGKAARAQTGGEATTATFHRPLGFYVAAFARAGLLVDRAEEWISQREATSGPRAPEENRARKEIPLFLALRGVKR